MKRLFYFSLLLLIVGCQKESKTLEPNFYRVTLKVQDHKDLPFIMKVFDDQTAEIYNADEVIKVDEIEYRNDSVFIKAPVFEGYIAAKISSSGFDGIYAIESYNRYVDVSAEMDSVRFPIHKSPSESLDGIWEVTFSPRGPKTTYTAKGIFKQNGNKISGTFRTNSGDYRFLEGVINRNQFQLSTFDGAHAFLFHGVIKGDKMEGIFYSGKHWKEPFIGIKNPDFELKNPEELTYLKEGYKTFDFSFPNEKGKLISLSDSRFDNKVKVIQLMGTWCPNCLDETKFLTEYAKSHPDIQILAISFEISKTKKLAFERINRLREKIDVPYPILLAQYGSDSKLEANQKLPMLSKVLAFPTTIFIDKKGKVRKIHTGFNGPATGQKYLDFKKEFDNFVALLQNE